MKIRAVLALASLLTAGAAVAGGFSFDVLFKFDRGTGVQPFRNSAAGPVLNTVAGVAPGGTPWLISSFDAIIRKNGDIRARGEGVLLAGGDGIGTRAGPRQMVLSLSVAMLQCRRLFRARSSRRRSIPSLWTWTKTATSRFAAN